MAAIRDGQSQFGMTLALWVLQPTTQQLAQQRGFTIAPLEALAVEAQPAYAKVNHGRWVVDCPDCTGAEFVWLSGPYQMFCMSCGNGLIQGYWRPVVMPEGVAEITQELVNRPLPMSRNWNPSEPLEALRAENRAMGVQGWHGSPPSQP